MEPLAIVTKKMLTGITQKEEQRLGLGVMPKAKLPAQGYRI